MHFHLAYSVSIAYCQFHCLCLISWVATEFSLALTVWVLVCSFTPMCGAVLHGHQLYPWFNRDVKVIFTARRCLPSFLVSQPRPSVSHTTHAWPTTFSLLVLSVFLSICTLPCSIWTELSAPSKSAGILTLRPASQLSAYKDAFKSFTRQRCTPVTNPLSGAKRQATPPMLHSCLMTPTRRWMTNVLAYQFIECGHSIMHLC